MPQIKLTIELYIPPALVPVLRLYSGGNLADWLLRKIKEKLPPGARVDSVSAVEIEEGR